MELPELFVGLVYRNDSFIGLEVGTAGTPLVSHPHPLRLAALWLKQHQKLFELEDVHLEFTPQALTEVVKEAKSRKTGARALRSILENTMLDIMYEVPSLENIDTCIITDEVIINKGKPIYKLLRKSA